jgi:levansucrase
MAMSGGPTRWTRQHLDRLVGSAATTAPLVDGPGPPRVLADHDIWDLWPVQDADGSPSVFGGQELWMALSAPATGHPETRHDVARIRLLAKDALGWHDRGNVFADVAGPGSREWSGCAVRGQGDTVSVFYTAAGVRGEARPSYVQRIIRATMTLVPDADGVRLALDGGHEEIVRSDGRSYLMADETDGGPGAIRAFRDPSWFLDPATGREVLLFAGSVPWGSGYMGAVGLAVAQPGGWELCPPLLVADGINHELERPHLVVHDRRYHLFLSTQRHAFDPRGSGPTGLYGFSAQTLTGPYEPLNGSGVVVCNPAAAPDQAYAWWVLPDLRVVGFLNYGPGDATDPRYAEAATARALFGGTAAPELRLAVDGLVTRLRR